MCVCVCACVRGGGSAMYKALLYGKIRTICSNMHVHRGGGSKFPFIRQHFGLIFSRQKAPSLHLSEART